MRQRKHDGKGRKLTAGSVFLTETDGNLRLEICSWRKGMGKGNGGLREGMEIFKVFHGVEGAVFLFSKSHGAVRSGAVGFWGKSYNTVPCGAVFFCMVRCRFLSLIHI